MDGNTTLFCEELVKRFPGLANIFKEHLADYDEPLPHVFMGDVSRYVISDSNDRIQIVEYLNESLRDGNNEIKDLIAVSFVENFPIKQDFEKAVNGVNAGALYKEWKRQQSF